MLFGIYQYGQRRIDDAVLVRIRPFTASLFAATVCWLTAARYNMTGLTVVCIFWMLVSLLAVFLTFARWPRNFSKTDQLGMVIPLSIYTGWLTVACNRQDKTNIPIWVMASKT